MPPKKAKKGKKGKKKKKEDADPNLLTEVDRTFYELQITDLNRKLARLRSETEQLEIKNEEMAQELAKVDEDRNDIIVYLKRMLQEKSDEVKEVQERLTALEETRQNEMEVYENKMKELEEEYKLLQEQLTSEIKLLEGKLNALEEFRVQRDELMRKYEAQEVQMDEQEKRHKRELYETEKKFIIGKDKLKKEMEARLLQLSTEFHDATELRIASTTHRVIRENIAINNELEIMLGTHKRLHSENTKMKERDKELRQKAELFEAETKRALRRSKIQTNVIDRLTEKNKLLDIEMTEYAILKKQYDTLMKRYDKLQIEKADALHNMKIVEQNLHQSRVGRATLESELIALREENDAYVDIIYEAVSAIKGALCIGSSSSSEESFTVARRESLLNNLLTLMTTIDNKQYGKAASVSTVGSIVSIYATGDLGFVPKPVVRRSKIPTKYNVECQVGSSLDLQSSEKGTIDSSLEELDKIGDKESKTDVAAEETSVHEEERISQVFFDDEESCEEESTVSYGSEDLRVYMASRGADAKPSEAGSVPENTAETLQDSFSAVGRSRSAYESDVDLKAKASTYRSKETSTTEKETSEATSDIGENEEEVVTSTVIDFETAEPEGD